MSRRKVWSNFIPVDGTDGSITESDLDKLAEIELNGRQIKNVVKTAGLIAMRLQEPLGVPHVKVVMGVMGNDGLVGNRG